MPKRVSVEHSPPRREIKQLQTHRQNDPRDNQTGPRCPQTANFAVSLNTEPRPQNVLNNPNHHVRRHVVRVVKVHERKIRDVQQIQRHAQQSINPHQRRRLPTPRERVVFVQAENADGRVEHAVHDAQRGGEVVELLGDVEVARVEDHAENPARVPAVSESDIVFAQRVARGDFSFQS